MVRAMKLLVYNNPNAGRKTFQKQLNTLVGRLVLEGLVECVKIIDEKCGDRPEAFRKAVNKNGFDLIMVLGGDGTIHEIVNIMMNQNMKIPILLIPTGTVNDFANYLYMPRDMDSIVNIIRQFKVQSVDVGKVNDRYFINVAFAGFLAKIGYATLNESKTALGRLAYYAEGIKEAREGLDKTYTFHFENGGEIFQTQAYLFAVLNSSSTGGFMNFAPYAEINDGLLDVIIIKKSDIMDMAAVFLKLIAGQHIRDSNVLYFKTDHLKVWTDSSELIVDIDGEKGVDFPLEFSVVSDALEFLIP